MSGRILRFCVGMAAVAGLGALVAPTASAAPANDGPIHRAYERCGGLDGRNDYLIITSNSAPNRAVCFADWGTLRDLRISQAVCVSSGVNEIVIKFSDAGAAPIGLHPGDEQCWARENGERTVVEVQIIKR
jgi:hypothetical protein